MKTLRQSVARSMVRVHRIAPELADYHVSQMDEPELLFRVRMYAEAKLSVAGPNPRAVNEFSTRFSRPQRRRQADGTQLRSRVPRFVMPESGKENLDQRPGRFLPRLRLP
jgi:hypothetical protein